MANICCEEMTVLVETISETSIEGVKISIDEHAPTELSLAPAEYFVPNIIFRFCPYCGKDIQPGKGKMLKTQFLEHLVLMVEGEKIEEGTSSHRKSVILEERLDGIKSLIRRARKRGKFWE